MSFLLKFLKKTSAHCWVPRNGKGELQAKAIENFACQFAHHIVFIEQLPNKKWFHKYHHISLAATYSYIQ